MNLRIPCAALVSEHRLCPLMNTATHDNSVDAMHQHHSASFLRSLQRIVPQAPCLSETIGSKFEQYAQWGALHTATPDRPGVQECNSHGGTTLLRWLATGVIASSTVLGGH